MNRPSLQLVIATHLETFDRFISGRLTKGEWTHEAHLVTCWVALRDRSPAEAVMFLRDAIKAHNCGIGIENTDESGYHETLTVYYVAAIAAARESRPEGLFEHEWCDRDAPLRHWNRDRLFSVEARHDWVPPDLADLPWPVATTTK